jgi:NADH-quinone oxidoreductase subunit N
VIGNLAALVQKDVKRLLAYSSVSQAGFMLIAIAANTPLGGRALLFYLIPYGAASIGAFAVVAARERELERPVTLTTLEGYGWERPFYGVAMWVFMLGFAGFPLTGGMIGKFYVFSAAYEAGWWWLVVIGVVATAVSIYYYLAVVRAMFMRPLSAQPTSPWRRLTPVDPAPRRWRSAPPSLSRSARSSSSSRSSTCENAVASSVLTVHLPRHPLRPR